jgi:site-specific DNA recombinase
MKSTTKMAVGYVRCSTEDQKTSLADQQEKIRAYCLLHGLTLVALLTDDGVSGKVPISEREYGSQIAAFISQGCAHVVCLKLDRAFRNCSDALLQTEEWTQQGVALHLIDMGGQSLDTRSAMGRMMLTCMAGFAEFERALIAERTTAALRHKKANGRVYSNAPYGKDATEDGALIDNTTELSVIDSMMALRASGTSYKRIADDLTTRNIPSKTGRSWHATTVMNILNSYTTERTHTN